MNKTNLEKEKVGSLTLPDFKTYSKATWEVSDGTNSPASIERSRVPGRLGKSSKPQRQSSLVGLCPHPSAHTVSAALLQVPVVTTCSSLRVLLTSRAYLTLGVQAGRTGELMPPPSEAHPVTEHGRVTSTVTPLCVLHCHHVSLVGLSSYCPAK